MIHEYEFGVIRSPTMNKQYKSIFNPGVARHLIKMGNVVSDIKADRNNPVKTIFLFEVTDKFITDLDQIFRSTTCNK